MSELLHTVRSVFDHKNGFLAEHGKTHYHIPLYQRGYKWTRKQVIKLLDDIYRFSPESGKFYCVQNITLVPKDDYFNVVDGQQRLTTMTLILSWIGESELVGHKVRFPANSIREKTNEFINTNVLRGEDAFYDDNLDFIGWEDFITDTPEFNHQDIYFLYDAVDAIDEWLYDKFSDETGMKLEQEKVGQFRTKLLDHVKFITNNIEGGNEERIFGNLNSKRIYLDGADLVRAILITRVTNEESKRQTDIKNIVRVNERRVRIGWRLDEINKWWSSSNVQKYFDSWIDVEPAGDVHFDLERYPINRLLSLFIESEGEDELSLEKIEGFESAVDLYNKLLRVDETLRDWYDDKEVYHSLGFLFNHKKNFSFNTVWRKWTGGVESREEFKAYLREEIKKEIFGSLDVNEVFGKSENWYGGETKTLIQILLLLDIIDSNKEFKDRLRSSAFSKSNNDIEHIFPQTPREPDEDKMEEEYGSYVHFLLKYDPDLKENELLMRFEEESGDLGYLYELKEFIEIYTSKIPVHSIGNLVLLFDSLNRSISNKPYSYKRKRVLQHHNEGNYIQPHTLKVFARYFQDGENDGLDLERWTVRDIQANETAIKTTLINYFNEEK